MPNRRVVVQVSLLGLAGTIPGNARANDSAVPPSEVWYREADRMRRLAESWGDQSYGAVLVLGAALAGEGPSRVVRDKDPNAHAERVAIADAQRRLGRQSLEGAVLYSTSRPCPACEAAAAKAGVSRLYFGQELQDGGKPSVGAL